MASDAAAVNGGAVVECRAVAVCGEGEVARVISLLRALCYHYEVFAEHHVALRCPLRAGTGSSALRLVRRLDPPRPDKPAPTPLPGDGPDAGWTMRLEGANMRGKAAAELPASVREVAEGAAAGPAAPQFWAGLGAELEAEEVHEGQRYLCAHAGCDIEASVTSVARLKRSALGPAGCGPAGELLGTSNQDRFMVQFVADESTAAAAAAAAAAESSGKAAGGKAAAAGAAATAAAGAAATAAAGAAATAAAPIPGAWRRYYLVEARCRVEGSRFAEGAAAVGAFGALLRPWVALRRAETRAA